jgi:class 3 adenylate cyclase/tetratricopeptide (TPR) repeat protein
VTHLLAPHLPRLSIDWITTRVDEVHRVEPGTVVFVDISGFTKLSEGLAKHGKVGAEELTATIGNCFVALLDLAVAYGGRLLKFGGDALLLYFSGEAHEARGCRAAVEMRRELRTVGRLTVLGQKVSLRMSVGIHSGDFHFFLVGDSHRELIVTGPAASTTVEMEGAADAGQIVISPVTAAALRPGLVGGPKGPGFLLRRAPEVPDDAFVPFEAVSPDVDIAQGIPVALRDTLLARHQEPEHRRVTVAFIHFAGTDDLVERAGSAEAARQLDELVRSVQVAVDRNDVTFLASDVDHDGGKIILTAGAPSTSGDDEHRMLLCVREIMDAGGQLPIRIGVNRGPVFVGEIGPPYRRTFTVMGDVVNLAARLMAKAAHGQIVVSPDVLSRSRTTFATDELEPFMVKGKAKSVRAFLLGEVMGDQDVHLSDNMPLVGRTAELEELGRHAREAVSGTGLLVELVGEPGSGKSRLLKELELLMSGRPLLTFSCQHYDTSTAYHVVRRLLRQLLELPADGSDDGMAEQFLTTVASRAPEVLPWAPLIGRAIGIPVAETEETRELDDEFRRPRLARAVLDLLAGLLPESGLLSIDDAHFMDEASADLFKYVAESVGLTSWVICLARRDLDTGFTAPEGASIRIDVGPLSRADVVELAQTVTADLAMSPRALDVLVDRSGGNPLFLRELLAAARDGGDVEQLPDTIDDVVSARIDSLSSDDRFLLRQLSVLGQSFEADLAREVLDELPHLTDPVWRRLDGFVVRDGPDRLAFPNGLLRDSAYDGLSFRQRREIHSRAADTLRQTTAGQDEAQPELLSFHYLNAQRYEEAWTYSCQAAGRAKEVYADFEATDFFERALIAGRRIDSLSAAEVSSIYEELGDARVRTGGYAAGATAYRAARRLVRGDPPSEARVVLKLARVQGWRESYAMALRWITKGLQLLEGVNGGAPSSERAELMCWYGRFCEEAGHHNRAISWCGRAATEAEAAGDRAALADALRFIDWPKMELGQLDEPTNSERALAIYEELGDLTGQAHTMNVLGAHAYWKGDWDRALECYRNCLVIDRRTGNPINVAFGHLNIGEIELDQGHLDEAEAQFIEAVREWRAAEYRSGVASATVMLARVAACRGHHDEAQRLFGEAVGEFRAIGSRPEVVEALARQAEGLLIGGDPGGALALADDTLIQAKALGGVSTQLPLLLRVRGAAMVRCGDAEGAAVSLRSSLDAAQVRGAQHEVALTLGVMAQLPDGVWTAADVDPRMDSEATLARLGVVWTPDLLGADISRGVV